MFNISHKTELLRTLWMLLAICNWNDFQLLSSNGLLVRFHFHTDGSPNSANVRHFSKAHKTQNEIEHCGTQVRLKPVTAGEKIDRFLWPMANKKNPKGSWSGEKGGRESGTPNAKLNRNHGNYTGHLRVHGNGKSSREKRKPRRTDRGVEIENDSHPYFGRMSTPQKPVECQRMRSGGGWKFGKFGRICFIRLDG